MNSIVKYFAISGLIATAWMSAYQVLYNPPISSEPEIIKGKIVNLEEGREKKGEKEIYFDLEYVTGERTKCSRLITLEYMYGDCGIMGSGNHRDISAPLPKDEVEICCPHGRHYIRCVLPGDSHYEGCLERVAYFNRHNP